MIETLHMNQKHARIQSYLLKVSKMFATFFYFGSGIHDQILL